MTRVTEEHVKAWQLLNHVRVRLAMSKDERAAMDLINELLPAKVKIVQPYVFQVGERVAVRRAPRENGVVERVLGVPGQVIVRFPGDGIYLYFPEELRLLE